MTTITELIKIYIQGLKQLFYYRPREKGEKGKLSILKIIILIAYIFAYIFAFYQFSESNITEAAIQEFRSDGSFIQIDSNLGIEDNWTISLWIIIDTRGTGVFFSIPDSSEVPGVEYSVNSDQRFQIRNFNSTNDGVVLTGMNTVQENRWYCIAGTYDGTQVKLYVNGTEEGSMNMTGATRANYNKTFIGSFSDTCRAGANATRGSIVEVRILDHALPAREIFKDYDYSRSEGKFPRRKTHTVAWYHLKELTLVTNIAKDSSPNGFDSISNNALASKRMSDGSGIWEETLYFEPYDIDGYFPFSIYGQLAILMNLTILIGAIFFLLIGDRPLTIERIKGFKVKESVKQIRDFSSRSRYHSMAAIAILFIIMSLLIFVILFVIEYATTFGIVMSICIAIYWIGKIMVFVIWPMISPVLVFGAFLISLDIFAKDYPKLMKGFNFRSVVLFLVCLFVNLAALFIILDIFNVAGPIWTDQPTGYAKPVTVEGLEGVYFYEFGLWWATFGIFIVAITMLVLIAIEVILGLRRGSSEIQEKRKANLLFIYPFVFIYLISKAIPYIITFGPRLKTLNNIIDLLSLLIIIVLGIFRVLGVQEGSDGQNLERKDKTSLKERVSTVPPYCKALYIFFLAFASFYISIEANLILALFDVQNISRSVRLLLSVIFAGLAIGFVFWRYQPFGGTTSRGSNKGENQTDSVSNNEID